jgi:hypothetical protein
MVALKESFTSTGSKLFWHQEAMQKFKEGKGTPIVSHLMVTDACNFKCSFCSVHFRNKDVLPLTKINNYLDQLCERGLKAVIISGGGNPILYKCPETKTDFNGLIDSIHARGLEIGLISNGMKMKQYPDGRWSWLTVNPETLDKLTWLRISLSGWDHPERECYTPDIDPSRTTLGGSYVFHNTILEPADDRHGRVSTMADVITPLVEGDGRIEYGMDRLPWLKEKMIEWKNKYNPRYCRLLPNCLEPSEIEPRSRILNQLAQEIDPEVFFVQQKPPRQPKRCLKGYFHPVANCDAFVYPCDSTVLSSDAKHKFGEKWRICKMEDIGKFYDEKIRANVPNDICPGCVFSDQVDLISAIADGMDTPAPLQEPEHSNFV